MTVQEYLDAKYSAGGPGSARFEPDATEVHSSQVSDCQRKRKWKHDRAHHAGSSPYFELGRVFEVMYGAALAYEHCPSISENTLKRHPPWEVVDRAVRVKQDVGVTIEFDDFDIVGECDWVVFESDLTFDHVTLSQDGSRTVEVDGEEHAYEGDHVMKVVETKTKGDVKYVRYNGPDEKHVYQVYPYMKALDCDGEIAYMQRNDWTEHVVELDFDEAMWMDSVVRARQHHGNMMGSDLPPASPLNEKECNFCPFQSDCRANGGSPHL